MVNYWEPGVQYNLGDVVEYEGKRYRIIQPHRSQGDWTPPVTPALWGLIPAHDCGDDYKPPAPQYQQPDAPQQGWDAHQVQQTPIDNQERQKHWYDLDDKRKKELEVGGGLAAGVALLAGGYAAYQHHEHKNDEERKAQAWGAQNWLHDAQGRTQNFYQDGGSSPVSWVLVHGTRIPDNAFVAGDANGNPLYVARAFFEGGVQVGKAARSFNRGAVIGYGHREVELDTYEVLVADPSAVQWCDARGRFRRDQFDNCQLVEAGREQDGTPLFIAQAPVEGGTHVGKVSEKLSCALVAANGREVECEVYRVLCTC